jgi:hypothetical protein
MELLGIARIRLVINTLLGHPPRALAVYDGGEPASSL